MLEIIRYSLGFLRLDSHQVRFEHAGEGVSTVHQERWDPHVMIFAMNASRWNIFFEPIRMRSS